MFFIGLLGDFNGEFSWVFHEKSTMNMAWEPHEKSMKISLILNASWPMKKLQQTKNPMKMPWNKNMKPPLFCSWLFNDNEKAMNWKAIFMVSEFMGFSWGFLNSRPIKEPWVFRDPWIIPLAYFSWERQRHGHHENLVSNYSRLLNQIHHWGFVGWLIWSSIYM